MWRSLPAGNSSRTTADWVVLPTTKLPLQPAQMGAPSSELQEGQGSEIMPVLSHAGHVVSGKCVYGQGSPAIPVF
jgi:hypothetical protein